MLNLAVIQPHTILIIIIAYTILLILMLILTKIKSNDVENLARDVEYLTNELSLADAVKAELNLKLAESDKNNFIYLQKLDSLGKRVDTVTDFFGEVKEELTDIAKTRMKFEEFAEGKSFADQPSKQALSKYKSILTNAFNLCNSGTLTKSQSENLFNFFETNKLNDTVKTKDV